MSKETVVSVFVKSKIIQAAKIVARKTIDPIEMKWSENLLPRAFVTIRDRYHAKKLSIVLDDDCGDLADKIKQIVKDAGVKLEVIEQRSVSTTRHSEPLIGITIKDDPASSINNTSDSRPVFQTEEIDTPSISLETPTVSTPRKLNKKLLLLIIGCLVLIVIIVIIVLVLRKSSTSSPSPEASPSPTSIVITTPTPSPSPASSKELATYKLQILNGSGVVGQAGAVNTLLKTAGFDTAKTGNAENYDYTDTIVQFKVGISDSVYTSIEMALNGKYTLKKGDALPDSSDYDIIVIVGTKLSSE